MKTKLIILGIFLLLIIAGCSGEPLTPKEQAQKRLLDELNRCDSKFGSNDYDDKLAANQEYCGQMAKIVERKIDEGWFDDGTARQIIRDIPLETPLREDVKEEIKKIEGGILGDI